VGRLARIVIPNVPYHVAHRGNKRGDVFFDDRERRLEQVTKEISE